MSLIEIGLAVLGLGNGYLLLVIQLKLTQLEMRLKDELISKNDFAMWTRESNYLPTFKRTTASR
jgi:hypothetical protein